MAVAFGSLLTEGTGESADVSVSVTPDESCVVVVAGGYDISTGTVTWTLNGNAPDTFVEVSNGGDLNQIMVWSDEPQSSITLASSGIGSDDMAYGAYTFSGVDTTELDATGAPDTGTSTADPSSIALTTVSGDAGVSGAHTFNSNSADQLTQGAGQVKVFEQYVGGGADGHDAGDYELSTGTTTTMTWTGNPDVLSSTALVLPFAAAAGGTILPQMMQHGH